eukprot:GILK01010470.1.p1 GENE.GILK01010470.1~~GILK01010470.1.p1  ORF type:complete len:163 (+),score=17.03 GILK01010470.1:179-667(+)
MHRLFALAFVVLACATLSQAQFTGPTFFCNGREVQVADLPVHQKYVFVLANTEKGKSELLGLFRSTFPNQSIEAYALLSSFAATISREDLVSFLRLPGVSDIVLSVECAASPDISRQTMASSIAGRLQSNLWIGILGFLLFGGLWMQYNELNAKCSIERKMS